MRAAEPGEYALQVESARLCMPSSPVSSPTSPLCFYQLDGSEAGHYSHYHLHPRQLAYTASIPTRILLD